MIINVAFEESDQSLAIGFSETDENVPVAFSEVQMVMDYGDVPIATGETAGIIKVGRNLVISNGVLSVDTASVIEQDNTKPVTSAAVHTELGNIEALLNNI